MKNSKICPKCKSQHIVNVDNSRGEQFTPIKTGILTVAKIDCYVCCDCGYINTG